MLGAPLLFAIELTILYAAGYYAMGRLTRISGFGGSGSVLGRMVFYLLVFPGVVLHEGAHFPACLLTGTGVSRFAGYRDTPKIGTFSTTPLRGRVSMHAPSRIEAAIRRPAQC
jgi:hypothetical protein